MWLFEHKLIHVLSDGQLNMFVLIITPSALTLPPLSGISTPTSVHILCDCTIGKGDEGRASRD